MNRLVSAPPAPAAPRVLADMIAALHALRETVANACELHARELSVVENDETSALVSWINDLFCCQNEQLDILREKLPEPRTPQAQERTAGTSAKVADFYTRLRTEERSFILRDLFTLLNLAASECAMLHSAALALKEGEIARAALAQLREIPPVLLEIGRLLPAATIADLTGRGAAADPLAADTAQDEIQKAWLAPA
jgi:hypothetical protein